MEETSAFRRWDELVPDALALIFKNLDLEEIVTVIPSVCKSWGRVVSGPYCWQDIDIEEWSRHQSSSDIIERMLRSLIPRSCGSLLKLCVSGLYSDSIFTFIAQHAGSLQTLRLPGCYLNDSVVEHIASRLSTVTFMDLSYCEDISARALEAVGKHCPLLVGLCRNMDPVRTMYLMTRESMISHDNQACAIADTMPNLKHLEISHSQITTENVMHILSSCTDLELLDIRKCYLVKMDGKLKESFLKLKVLIADTFVYDYSDDDSDEDLRRCSDYLFCCQWLR